MSDEAVKNYIIRELTSIMLKLWGLLDAIRNNEFPQDIPVKILEQKIIQSEHHRRGPSWKSEKIGKRDLIKKIMQTDLTSREKKVIAKRYFKNMTLQQIAEKEGVSKERIRQIQAKAERRLRHPKYGRINMEDYFIVR